MINPRGPEFAELLADCTAGLKQWMGTDHDMLLMSASGTGALEAVVANLLSPGEQALFCTMGWFGELWARIAVAYGADVVRHDAAWGHAIDPAALADALDRHPTVRTVFLTHNETSTGVRNELSALAAVVKERGRLLAVDSVSGAPGHPLDIDALGADVVVVASQKGWLAPPGLAMAAVSPDALRASAQATSPRFYFDFALQKRQQDLGLTLTTPPLPAMYGLREGLALLQAEGREPLWERHRRTGARIRAALAALGLESVARSGPPSEVVTAVYSPFASSAELAAFLTRLKSHYGVVVAEGVGPLHGRSFRIGHLGALGEQDVTRLLERLEDALNDFGLGRLSDTTLAA
jgi:aspartate aminotransferase-like enzyme